MSTTRPCGKTAMVCILFNTVTGQLDAPGSRDFYQSSTKQLRPAPGVHMGA